MSTVKEQSIELLQNF